MNTQQLPQSHPQFGAAGLVPEDQRRYGMFAHLWAIGAMIFSLGTLGFVVSVVLWLVWKDKGPFVRQHAANAVNIQIWTAIYLAISGLLMYVLIGFVLLPIVFVWSFVLHVLAARAATRGEYYHPPLTPRIFR